MSVASSEKRKIRVRASIRRKGNERPRLSVFRSNSHIYAQVIDDSKGLTLACASTMDDELSKLTSTSNAEAAKEVGKLVAGRALKAEVKKVVFDRGSYMFHGRVKALAEGAREAGLEF